MDISFIFNLAINAVLLAYFFGKLRGDLTALKDMVDFRFKIVEKKVDETNHVKARLLVQEEKSISINKRIDELKKEVDDNKEDLSYACRNH